MGLSGFSGLTGSAGDFRRRLRVDESSERRMASPWQFSPYLPSLSKCSAARSQVVTDHQDATLSCLSCGVRCGVPATPR